MGNDISKKYGSFKRSTPRRSRKMSTKNTNSDNGIKCDATEFHSRGSESENSNQSESMSQHSSSSEISNGTDSAFKQRRSSLSDRQTKETIFNQNNWRTRSLRGTKSEPQDKLSHDRPRMLDRRESEFIVNQKDNKPPVASRTRVSTVISTESGLMELYQLPLERPLYVKLQPLFNVADNARSNTKYVVTVWLKYALQKKISAIGQLYEADISFSEAKVHTKEDNNNEGKKGKKELVMAHTWNGKTTSVLITKKNITFQGNFVNSDCGTLDYLEFELILNPIKSMISKGLIEAAHSMTLMHLSVGSDDQVVGPEKCSKMIGWFTFRDKRAKTYKEKEFVWRASVLINPQNEHINDTLHMKKI